MVYTQVVCNPQSPWQELSFICIVTASESIDDLDEYILENVFCQVSVFYQNNDGGKNSFFVSVHQIFQCPGISVDEKLNQLVVSDAATRPHKKVFRMVGFVVFALSFHRYHMPKL
jgi:hypothetical protein